MSILELTNQNVAHRSATTLKEVFQRDIVSAFRAWPLWTMLAWNDVHLRYRRSTLGPIWITISMALFIGALSVVYSVLFGIDIATYFPYLTAGYILWGFIASCATESCSAFPSNASLIRQIRLPFGIFVLRIIFKNFIVFLHTVVIFVIVAIIFQVSVGPETLLALPGFALLYINLIWVGLVLAIISARYRDVINIVQSAVQITIFVTPIIWQASRLGDWGFIAYFNPVFHLIDVVRGPLIDEPPLLMSWIFVVVMAFVGWAIAVLLLRRAANRIVFWL